MIADDSLKYRIPQKEIVELNGNFRKVTSFKGQEGFVVTDFTKNEKFLFEEEEFDGICECNFSKKEPIVTSKDDYLSSAANFLKDIKEQKIDKAVFSRIKKITYQTTIIALFNQLCELYPNAFVYLVSSKHFGTWIGASPEKLLQVKGNLASTISLAGTKKSDDLSEWGEKESLEQEYVTNFIKDKLKGVIVDEVVQFEKEELLAGPVKHLATRFEFKIKAGEEMTIANLLHPTPAVSGYPQGLAMNLIEKHENHSRSLYAGIIGVLSKDETNLFVNLRCSQLINNQAFLHLGGGFTKDSIIQKEWEETESKAKTLLKVFQNS